MPAQTSNQSSLAKLFFNSDQYQSLQGKQIKALNRRFRIGEKNSTNTHYLEFYLYPEVLCFIPHFRMLFKTLLMAPGSQGGNSLFYSALETQAPFSNNDNN